MTPRERAMEVLKMPWRPDHDPYSPGRREFLLHEELEGRLEQAIIAAVEEEREACAQIAEEENERCESAADAVANNPFTTIDESTGHEMAAKAARRIMLKIRAHSAASPADIEGEKE